MVECHKRTVPSSDSGERREQEKELKDGHKRINLYWAKDSCLWKLLGLGAAGSLTSLAYIFLSYFSLCLRKKRGGTHPLYITTDNYWWSPKLTSPGALPCHAPFLLSGSFLSYPLHIFPISYLLLWSQHCQQELSPKPYLFAICTASLMWTSSALGV